MKALTYVATPKAVKQLTLDILAATQKAQEGPGTYLRLLLGTTQHDLGAKEPKQEHRGRQPKLSAESIQAQLAALDAVHERFYAAVVEAAEIDLPRGKDSAKILNRRTNFARSSVSTLRSYVKAGNDLTRVVVARATKRSLTVERAVRPPSPARLRSRVEARSKAFVTAVLELSEMDKATALGELELLMGQLAQQVIALGGTIEREQIPSAPVIAPVRIRVPVTETHVERQRARPS